MPSFTTLLLDADGTLLDFNRAEEEAISAVLREFRLPDTRENRQLYHRINDRLWKALELGQVTKDQLRVLRFSRLFQALELKDPPSAAQAALRYQEYLSRGSWLLPGVAETVPVLARRCRLLVITNGIAAVQQRRWAACPIHRYIDRLYISDLLGAQKPSPAFFDAVFAAEPGLRRGDCLVVGDSLSSDILGGKNAGIATCWIAGEEQAAPPDCRPDYRIPSLRELPALLEREAAR